MQYDPVKDRLGFLFGRHPGLMRLFFALMNVLLLRSWHVRRALHRLLRDRPQPVRVLDAGTGFGQYAWFVARTFGAARVVAVDIKQDYLARARALFRGRAPNITVEYDDLTTLQATGPFDCILAVDVLEHIEDDCAVLANFARVLAPGGQVVISTPSDLGGSDAHADGGGGFIGEHVRSGYNKVALEQKLQQAGLGIRRSRYTYGRYGSLAWRLLLKVPLAAINRSWGLVVLLPFYYLLILPFGLVLHMIDTHRENPRGSGLLVIAEKP